MSRYKHNFQINKNNPYVTGLDIKECLLTSSNGPDLLVADRIGYPDQFLKSVAKVDLGMTFFYCYNVGPCIQMYAHKLLKVRGPHGP